MFRRGISRKIWLGYAVPLAVLLIAGVLVPGALGALLGRITRASERSSRFVEQVGAMERAAISSETNLRGYLLTAEEDDRSAFLQSRDEYVTISAEIRRYALEHDALRDALAEAHAAYAYWLRTVADPQIARGGGGGGDGAINTGRAEFARVRAALGGLKATALRLQRVQARNAGGAERVRRTMMLVGPAAALLLALLIGRSIAVGVTEPLLALTDAARALERGQTTALLLPDADGAEDGEDDELSDLKRAFAHMARAIGQREAVLRAQNEALGALNRRIEAVLNATNDGILLLDRAGGFSVVNQRLAGLFGLDRDDLIDHPFEQAGPLLFGRFADGEGVGGRLRALIADPRVFADETHELAAPEHRVLRVYSAPVRGEDGAHNVGGGELLGRIFVFRDVTREFAVDRMKTEFISVVSHELRTPLTAIKGYVELILGDETGPINALQREFLGIVLQSADRLTALIADMLDIARIESGRMEMRCDAVDYGRVLRDSVTALAHVAEAKGIALSLEAPPDLPLVRGDADRIAQVLLNLIGNGIKYTPPGGRVIVRVAAKARGFLITEVTDTGIGIAPEDQERLFEKFFRADNSLTREAGGTGLGLAITRAIVEKLHGGIWVKSEPGRGSSFLFTLPAAGTPRAAAE